MHDLLERLDQLPDRLVQLPDRLHQLADRIVRQRERIGAGQFGELRCGGAAGEAERREHAGERHERPWSPYRLRTAVQHFKAIIGTPLRPVKSRWTNIDT